ncbi:hypothetical protein BDB00DRAFT_981244 [Zychaea mexicana]|uniref:uncharacterized protein n=1 Tax=Zychaea mexicana TaxID=64656 RepID=UPI0022FDD8ED|nr:uncharacterized protein BDB00DRAFT_981244 [Zychaea mexicana]KAI9489297.1 hypothetical protein BDB00DRAFT_981244 [Zychaea mexicana]
MFKKPPSTVKSFSPLRSSDRRRFQNEAYEAFPHLKERCTQEGASPLMPDPLQSAKFRSHINENGVLYVADGKPLWMKLEGLKQPVVPTVYTLWQHPDTLPLLYTWGPVIHRLTEGADLMIPGLVLGPEGKLPDLGKGDLVAITIKGYPYPLAVGTMALPTSEIRVRSGMKGKAVHLIHVYRDHLWAMGDKSDPPETVDISDDGDDEYVEDDGGESKPNELQIKDDAKTVPVDETSEPKEHDEQEEAKPQLPVKEVDSVLHAALLQALKFKITSENSQSHLPISASTLYSTYILPCRPRGRGSDADIKGSSWKKVQKFLKAMEKTKLLKVKEQRGEMMVTSVNWMHESFQGLDSYKTVGTSSATQQQQQQQQKTTANTTNNSTTAKSPNHSTPSSAREGQINVEDVFRPHGSPVHVFFEAAKLSKEELYTSIEIRNAVMQYVKENNLSNPRNQKMVLLDAILKDAILKNNENKEELTREVIVDRLREKMQPFHYVTLPGKEPVLRKGTPTPIQVTQEIRQGRKTMTKLVGVERFDLDVVDLCKELTKLCASSATHNPLAGSSPKNPVQEIMVQGPQIKNVSTILSNKGVPKRLIVIEDKTAKKGKGKK